MNLSIRHWLIKNYIEISHIKECSQGQMTGVTLRIIQDMEVNSPSPFDICTLAEVLELPLSSVFYEVNIFARLSGSILDLLGRDKPFNRNEAAWLAFQVAYLRALEEVLIEEQCLSRVWLERGLVCLAEQGEETRGSNLSLLSSSAVKPLQDEHLQAVIKNLREEKLTDMQAEEALLTVGNSSFVEKINTVVIAWLVANNVIKSEAELIIRRLKNKLLGHLIVVVSENSVTLVQLQKFFRLGGYGELKSSEKNYKFNDYIHLERENYRASLLRKLGEPLFIESFCLKDIYIPLSGLPLRGNHQPVDLMKWVIGQLDDLETITVVESESGYGKTSFCQILAARIAKKLYPEWIPIVINLREIEYEDNFIDTLQSGLRHYYQINLSNWLLKTNDGYLLILDGLNELPNCIENKMAIAIFMYELFEFQKRYKHKIILTSQSWALEDILSQNSSRLQRIKIQPWEQEKWKQWFASWAQVQSMTVAQSFFKLLKNQKAFSKKSHFLLSDLVSQPLILYLLSILYRDELLDKTILQSATNPQITNSAIVLWKIYERLNQWLLGYPSRNLSQKILTSSASTYIHRTPELVKLLLRERHPQELIDEMQAVALRILHSGRNLVTLQGDFSRLPRFYFQITVNRKDKDIYTTQITTNSTQLSPSLSFSKIQFSHRKLGEYLCAKAIINQLKIFTKYTYNVYGEMIFHVDSPINLAEHLYNLFGYGILTREIEELVIEGLRQEKKDKFSFEVLCNRLQNFWYAYCAGRWLDEGIAHKAWSYFKQRKNPINVEQVNAAAGINVFLILSACYRETKNTFFPCGNISSIRESYPQALTKLIAKTAVFHPDTTRQRIAEKSFTSLNLVKADFTQAMLAGVNFSNTDLANVQLKDACLAGANLADVNLTGADLTGANLTNTNLTNAKLTGANLTGANLLGVNLDLVNLSNACLFEAIISEGQKDTALANGAVFSLEKFQELKRLLSYQSHSDDTDTGEKTEIAQFSEDSYITESNPSIGRIESAEGEPIISLDLDLDDDIEDETVLGISDF